MERIPDEFTLYAHRREGSEGRPAYWWDIHDNARQLRFYRDAPIYQLQTCRTPPNTTPDLWGWWSTERPGISMIWPGRLYLEMCLPYGIETAVDCGSGVEMHLTILNAELFSA